MPNDEEQRKEKEKDMWTQLARYSEIGFIIPAAVIAGYLCGLLLDHLLHTHWFYIGGLIFGAVVGFVQMIRTALRSMDE